MTDERNTGWFAPDLRDVRSAFVAEGLAWGVMAAALSLPFVTLFPTPPPFPPPWQYDFNMWLLFGGLLGGPVVILVVAFFSRYRALGLALPLSVVPLVVAGSQYFGMFAITPHLTVIYAALVALTVGQFTRRWPGERGKSPSWQRVIASRYWWVRTGVVLAQGVGVGVTVKLVWPLVSGEWYVVPLSVLFALSLVLCVWCWLRFLRPFVELCLEPIARTLYRIKAKGTKQFPPFGPCLVIANHAFWFDPCVLGVVLPRPITPIMTQRFFDVWFLRPLLKYVFRVIVVPETPIKRTTPELEQAVAALDRGEVVVIFPEGYLRRKEEVPLRRFGQGVWRILSARPDTPVVACWIEGGWGSKFSYKDGPPTVNKRMDFRRQIDVAASAPETVPAEVLADQMTTRIHLMNRVAAMRTELGLAPLPVFQVTQAAEHQDEPA
jgi:1-acyl-sn-glycerol-3-phosphate acyltransferase